MSFLPFALVRLYLFKSNATEVCPKLSSKRQNLSENGSSIRFLGIETMLSMLYNSLNFHVVKCGTAFPAHYGVRVALLPTEMS